MRILLASVIYPPEPLVSGQVSYELAHELASRGHHVTVVRPRPSRSAMNSSPVRVGVYFSDGVEVLTVDSIVAPSGGLWRRFLENISFGFAVSKVLVERSSLLDVVYMNVWPLFSQAIITSFCKSYGIPVVTHIQDLYPEALIPKIRGISGRLLWGVLWSIDYFYSRAAYRAVVVSENLRSTYVRDRQIPPARVLLVYNWQSRLNVGGLSRKSARLRLGICERSLVYLYFGNVGPVAHLEFLVDAFAGAAVENSVLIIGGGGELLDNIRIAVARYSFSRILVLGSVSQADMVACHLCADIAVLPMRPDAGLSSVPSKLSAYLNFGLPTLVMIDPNHEYAKLISDAHCGWVCAADSGISARAAVITAANAGEDVRSSMGARGRKLADLLFSGTVGVSCLVDICEGAACFGQNRSV